MYQRKAIRPEVFAEAAGGWAYKAVYNKYWVDEAYYAVFLGGTIGLARMLAWFDRTVIDGVVNGSALVTRVASSINGAFDFRVVDGLVNLTADIIHGFGGFVRRIQTGSINAYLYVVVVVVTAVLFARAW
jgi:NADH-quinone oxidoreductase subunit L